MKTDAERMALIRQRTAQLQRQARARQMLLIDAGCMFPPPAPPGC